MMLRRSIGLTTALALGCGDGAMVSMDASADASTDARTDARTDVATDAAPIPLPPPGPLSVQEVVWNPLRTDLGAIQAVADYPNGEVLFTDRGATVMVGGAVASRANAAMQQWSSAAVLPAGDRSGGQWLVGVDGNGRVQRLRGLTAFETISDRYGLAGVRVNALGMLSATSVAFATEGGLSIADGMTVTRYTDPTFATVLAAGSARVAGASADVVRLFDPMGGRLLAFGLGGVTALAIDARGRLVASTATELYLQDDHGDLRLRYAGAMHGLVRSGERVWFAAGTELGALDGDMVRRSNGAGIAATARLQPSATGDVWVLAGASVRRFGPARMVDPDEASFERAVRPVFIRTCAQCHLPGGSAHIDLSTYAAWDDRRPLIRSRVLMQRNMPPAGVTFTTADRAAVTAWVGAM